MTFATFVGADDLMINRRDPCSIPRHVVGYSEKATWPMSVCLSSYAANADSPGVAMVRIKEFDHPRAMTDEFVSRPRHA